MPKQYAGKREGIVNRCKNTADAIREASKAYIFFRARGAPLGIHWP
jgi:hypothetical protein